LPPASLFADISTEMLYPVLPVFLTQTLKASGSIVGLIDGFAQAAQNIVQGFSGALSDKLQRRKPIAIVGYFLAAIAKPLMGLATVWPELFGARLLDRVGAGTRSAPRDALIASSVDEENRGRAFGLEGVGDNAGAFLGPLLAALLLYAAHVDLRTIFYLAVVPGLLALLMVLLVKERRVLFSAKSKIDISLGRFPKEYWRYLLVTATSPIAGDIILYQVHGDLIRRRIADVVANASEPVAILGHSLGGVAAAEILCEDETTRRRVRKICDCRKPARLLLRDERTTNITVWHLFAGRFSGLAQFLGFPRPSQLCG
jgi:MFS family permease